jgi:hypothetical protein
MHQGNAKSRPDQFPLFLARLLHIVRYVIIHQDASGR